MEQKGNRICFTLKDEDVLARYDKHFPVRGAAANMEILMDAYEEVNSLRNDLETLSKEKKTLQEQNSTLTENHSKLQKQYNDLLEASQTPTEDVQKIAELQQSLAESEQSLAEREQELAEAQQKLTAQRLSDDAIVIDNPGFVGKLLTATAEKLSVKYKREITPQMILQDMFLRYTVQRWSEWFYPFILKDKDIEEISGYTISQIKQAINK